jgi:aryl-alcohol dehydrogenase-like predicted oxidoreductase
MSKQPNAQPRRAFLKTLGAAGAGAVFVGNAATVAAADTPAVGPVPKRKFGRHSEMISSLALGGATLARAASIEEATRIVAAAIDCGVTFFDNAWEYSTGRAEEWMGIALQGKRDKVFLMTKVCTHNQGQETKDKALAMLEDSLRRLKTDHLDLWQVHQILTDAEADSIFMPGGVLEAIEQARKQGKIRYCGFTGHADPKVHLRVLAHHYPFDSVQMPLSVFDGHDNGFQKLVLPELLKQGIAPLAMKTLGGNAKPIKDGLVTSEECLRYALSLPIAAVISGIDTLEWLEKNARVAANFKPLSRAEMAALEERCSSKKQYEYYRRWAYLDGHPPQLACA